MENIFKGSSRVIATILTLGILLGIAGICVCAVSEMSEVKTVATEELTQELVPLMARGCDDYDDSDYDYNEYYGTYFINTVEGLNAIGVPFSGSGNQVISLNPAIEIRCEQRGTELHVFVDNIIRDKLISWFKVVQW